eukprot:1358008-Amorphochlora_amoeboformis.AAC.1
MIALRQGLDLRLQRPTARPGEGFRGRTWRILNLCKCLPIHGEKLEVGPSLLGTQAGVGLELELLSVLFDVPLLETDADLDLRCHRVSGTRNIT